jgi:hypothetical protein
MRHFLGKDHYLNNDAVCPGCGNKMDGASGIDHNDKPDPGDIGVCIKCGLIVVYTEDLKLRIATPFDLAECHPDTKKQIAVAVASVHFMIREKKLFVERERKKDA